MRAPGLLLPAIGLMIAGSTLKAQAPPPRATPAPRAAAPASPKPKPTPAPPPVLEGIVRGPDRKPIEKALVVARSETPQPGDTSLVTRTDGEGRFRLTVRSRKGHRVRAEAAGLAGRTLTGVVPGAPVTIDLVAGGAIEGVVRDGDTGEPAAGVSVETSDRDAIGIADDPRAGVVRATTDANGRFRLAGLGPGRHDVVARARGRGVASQAGVLLGAAVELFLREAGTIAGLVTGPDGKPVADAIVTPVGVRGGLAGPRSERTDAHGRYEVTGLSSGLYDVAVRAKGLAPGVVPDVTLDARSEARADVRLAQGARVVGRLVDARERPLAGRVSVGEIAGRPAPYVLHDLLAADAGTDGRFALDAIPTGDHALGAEARGQAPQRVEFSVSAAEAQVDLGDIRTETGLVIRGRVRTRTGEPVAEAAVDGMARRSRMSRQARTRTDADGSFVLAGLEQLPYRIFATAAGFGRGEQEAEPGAEPIELVLEAAGSISGRVVDDRGKPVESFRVVARSPIEGGPWSHEQVEAADGRFVLGDLSAGSYVVLFEAPEHASVSLPVKVAVGAATDVGTVRLGTGATLRGTVADATGAMVAGARIMLTRRQMNSIIFGGEADILTDRSGAFEAKGVTPGAIGVTASHPDYAPSKPLALVVEADRPTPDLRLVVGAGGRIEGSLRRRDGSGVAGALMNAASTDATWDSRDALVSTQADGTFTIEHVPAGRVRVTAMTPAGPTQFRSAQGREVEVREAETTRLDIVTREILLSGRVTRSGTPAPGLRVEARGDSMMTMGGRGTSVPTPAGSPERMTAVTREDGGFEMLVDEPGIVRLTVNSADGRYRFPTRVVRVPDAETFAVDLSFNGVTVTGTVVDEETDAPVPYATLYASRRPPVQEAGAGGTSGADGRFELELEPAEYRLGARDTRERYANGDVDIRVGPGGLADVRVPLPRGLRIAGRALDPAGRPLAGVEVQAESPGSRAGGVAETLADGSFDIRGLRSGDYVLSAWSMADLFAIRPRVAAGTTEIALALRPGGRVRIEAVSADGRPVAGAWSSVNDVDGVAVSGVARATAPTNALGATEMRAPAGRVTIRADKDGLTGFATLDLGPGEGKAVRIVLEAR